MQSNLPKETLIPTLNQMGFTTTLLDEVSLAWVDAAANAKLPVLDIGAAFGVASIAALRRGAQVIANDIDPRHLDGLRARLSVQTEPGDANLETRLRTLPGRFPGELYLPPDSVDSVLACRILHFLDGPTIEAGLTKILGWLAPGGGLFVVAETPYIGGAQPFIPIYEKRKREGAEWPGFIPDTSVFGHSREKALPPQMHMLEEDILARVAQRIGFEVVRAFKFGRPLFPADLQHDGRESMGLIARKPR